MADTNVGAPPAQEQCEIISTLEKQGESKYAYFVANTWWVSVHYIYKNDTYGHQ